MKDKIKQELIDDSGHRQEIGYVICTEVDQRELIDELYNIKTSEDLCDCPKKNKLLTIIPNDFKKEFYFIHVKNRRCKNGNIHIYSDDKHQIKELKEGRFITLFLNNILDRKSVV